MKFYFLTIASVVLVLCATAITRSAQIEAGAKTGIPTPLNESVVFAERGLDMLPLGSPRSAVIALLGPPERDIGHILSYIALGFRADFCSSGRHMKSFSMRTIPNARQKPIDFETEDGVGLGSPESEVYAAYGKPDHSFEFLSGFSTLKYYPINASFGVRDGVVVQISFASPHDTCSATPNLR